MRRIALVLALLIAGPAPADELDALSAARARLAEAGGALSGAGGETGDVAGRVAAITAYDVALGGMRDVVLAARTRERELLLDLASRREEMMQLAAALEGFGRVPPAPGLHPMGPLGAARARALIEGAVPGLEAQAAELGVLIAAVDAAQAVQGTGVAEISDGLGALDAAREDLERRVTPVLPQNDAGLAALVRASGTLSELVAALAGSETEGGEIPEGGFGWPVQGRVLIGFNARDGGGVQRPGLVVGAPGLSLVSAPAAGVVRYAGPFLDFGYVVVLRTGPGTHVVLAGLAELNVPTGAAVRRGDLLGRLGGRSLEAEEYVMLPYAETGAGALETLYIEIRHGRAPVDPAPWFGSESG